jgi:hypothetical protein
LELNEKMQDAAAFGVNGAGVAFHGTMAAEAEKAKRRR